MRLARAILLFAVAACGAAQVSPSEPPRPSASSASPGSGSGSASELPAPSPSATLPPSAPPPKVVLHTGDSMVGFHAGLEKALAPRFEALGARFVQDAVTSAAIITFDHSDHFQKMLASTNADLVIITLGANDVFLPAPSRLAKSVASIARRTEGRRCFWIGPPTWKKDTGIVQVIKDNCAPCIFYDSSALKLERRADGIHPDDKGGEQWANAFWDFYSSQPEPPVAAIPGTATPVTAR